MDGDMESFIRSFTVTRYVCTPMVFGYTYLGSEYIRSR